MKLSIAVITMNRAHQLIEALDSCLACNLPNDTEFVVIDNASTDDTEQAVKAKLDNCGYSYYYEKLPENIGAGAGRCYAYEKTSGEYVYGLDDDAVISLDNPDFFIKAIEVFETDDEIVTLGTQIYDLAWGKNRQNKSNVELFKGVYLCKMFSAGSHFIKKEFFKGPPYFRNIYGYEELPPCLIAFDKGKKNAFCEYLVAIHKPKVDKWDLSNPQNYNLLINECATPYAIKKMMYPCIFRPIMYFAFRKRCKMYLANIPNGKKRAKKMVKETVRTYKINKKIKVKTVTKMFKDFGLSVF